MGLHWLMRLITLAAGNANSNSCKNSSKSRIWSGTSWHCYWTACHGVCMHPLFWINFHLKIQLQIAFAILHWHKGSVDWWKREDAARCVYLYPQYKQDINFRLQLHQHKSSISEHTHIPRHTHTLAHVWTNWSWVWSESENGKGELAPGVCPAYSLNASDRPHLNNDMFLQWKRGTMCCFNWSRGEGTGITTNIHQSLPLCTDIWMFPLTIHLALVKHSERQIVA